MRDDVGCHAWVNGIDRWATARVLMHVIFLSAVVVALALSSALTHGLLPLPCWGLFRVLCDVCGQHDLENCKCNRSVDVIRGVGCLYHAND